MNRVALKAFVTTAGLAAALVFAASTSRAGTLVAGYTNAAVEEHGLSFYNDALVQTGSAVTPRAAIGLAAGGGYLYTTTSSPMTNYVERYDGAGAFLNARPYPDFFDPGPLAFGDGRLFLGFAGLGLGGAFYGVGDAPADLSLGATFEALIDSAPAGLAIGDGSLFVSYESKLLRYGLDGAYQSGYDFGSGISLGALTFGAGQLFAAFEGPSGFGYASVDPDTYLAGGALVSTTSKVRGLAFGDGAVFASSNTGITKYDLDGNLLINLETGRFVIGPLAYISDASAAPEPTAWALMILGFSAAGAALRQRRRILIRHG